ncbi:GET complex subunit GET2 [Maudiozyma barnettii]|uniref:Golgi to ER traffic protein 2 n=1 Tax=Maudiozyma barnettii TaxID=61262 RepID=A0A8H2ZGY2_9SACH|nr:GET complex subunit GET2 [Kazachstania barnettii]CAB4253997.1 similar to Saccharomyces cerevisiae YER083C GET2 Subunit of the GET complex [Kazachstania barnettii]
MSNISEAEKRKLFRERRQKKFSNGGATSRLNKITGQADSQLNTESPLDNPKNEFVLPTERKVETTSSHDDIHNEKSVSESENTPQVELLKQLASMQKEGSDSTPDLFSLLSSMQQNGVPNANGFSEIPSDIPMAPLVDPAMLNYHNYLVSKLKAWTILLKWIVLVPFLYLVTRGEDFDHSSILGPLSNVTDSTNFFMVFTAFEIVATSIYYQRLQNIERNNKVNTLDNNSKIVKMVSIVPEGILPIKNIKGKVVTLLQYWDVLAMFISDICLVLIVIGIFQKF